MAGSITISSITLDSDNNFSIKSNTGSTILSANGTGLLSSQLTTPTITGNLNFDTTGTTGFNTATANTVRVHTAGVEAFRIDSSQNVGIGTSSPATKLHLNGGTFRVQDSTGSGGYRLDITSDSSSGALNTVDNVPLVFKTNSTERMRIDSSGQAIIGATDVGRGDKLTVVGAGTLSTVTSSVRGLLAVESNSSTAQNVGGAISLGGNYDGGRTQYAAIGGYKESTTSSEYGGYLALFTRPNGDLTKERMRINSSGQLLVGTTSSYTVGSQTGAANVCSFNWAGLTLSQYGVYVGLYYDRLNFTNSQYFVVNSSGTGVYLGNGSTSWTAYSDVRLKNVTGSFTNALSDVSKLEPIRFTWKNDTNNKPCVGLAAHTVEEVLPEAVDKTKLPDGSGDETEYLAVRYTEVIPLLVASIKELKALVDAQATEIAELKAKVA